MDIWSIMSPDGAEHRSISSSHQHVSIFHSRPTDRSVSPCSSWDWIQCNIRSTNSAPDSLTHTIALIINNYLCVFLPFPLPQLAGTCETGPLQYPATGSIIYCRLRRVYPRTISLVLRSTILLRSMCVYSIILAVSSPVSVAGSKQPLRGNNILIGNSGHRHRR